MSREELLKLVSTAEDLLEPPVVMSISIIPPGGWDAIINLINALPDIRKELELWA